MTTPAFTLASRAQLTAWAVMTPEKWEKEWKIVECSEAPLGLYEVRREAGGEERTDTGPSRTP
jgi:hypothetical protein